MRKSADLEAPLAQCLTIAEEKERHPACFCVGMEQLILIVFAVVFFVVVAKYLGSSTSAKKRTAAQQTFEAWEPPKADSLPYARRPHLFSTAERSFYEVLRRLLPGYTIFAKIRMSDLLNVPKGSGGWQTHFNRIQSKHVDFVLCDAQLTPILAVELDDASHKRADRQERDRFVDEAFLAAGLPIVHVPAKRGYVLADLRALLAEHLVDSAELTAGS